MLRRLKINGEYFHLRCLCQCFLGLLYMLWFGTALAATPKADQLTAAFQAALEQIVTESGVPGGVAAYVLPDGRMVKVAAGLADREAGLRMSPDARMLAGSVGKTFVGALALSLAADDVLDLDRPISTWLGGKPWFSRLPNSASITLRHLLDHGSGLVDHVNLPEFATLVAEGNLNPARETLIALVLDREPLFPAGQGFAYTDTGYLLAGMVFEAVTGRTYYGELRRRFLDPLALTLTTPSDHKRLPGLVPGYLPVDNPYGLPPKTLVKPGVLVYDPSSEWTGGGLVSNAGDLARWAKVYYEGKAMGSDYLSILLKGGFKEDKQGRAKYSLGTGFGATPYGPAYGHSGWIPGYVSFVSYFAKSRVAIAVQFNSIESIGTESDALNLARERLPAVIIGAK